VVKRLDTAVMDAFCFCDEDVEPGSEGRASIGRAGHREGGIVTDA